MDREGCDQCGSFEYYIDAGRTYCANGHDQNQGPEVASDEDDYGTQGRRVRATESKPNPKILRVYRGNKAYRLFLQAYQHILWKQCHALINEKGFPAELWLVVRDLWSIRLSKLHHKLEDPFDGSESESHDISSGVNSQDQNNEQTISAREKLGICSPTLLDTVCLCYMAILLLRLPVSLSQILHWIRVEDLPYIRAIRHVPTEMKDKLPGEYHEALDTSTILRPDALQLGISNLCAMYDRLYGLSIAPLNWTPILYQYVENLSLPLEVYAVVKKLNDIVSFDFMFVNSGRRRRRAISYPEAQLMSLVIIATKLLYPFDNDFVRRNPRDASEPAILSIDWSAWADQREARSSAERARNPLHDGVEINVRDEDVFGMSSPQLDQYLDWYERTWVRTDIADDDVNKELFDMFPQRQILGKPIKRGKARRQDETNVDQISYMQASLKTNEIISDKQGENLETEVVRPGMQYPQFRDQDGLRLSRVAELLHHEAADLSCLSIATLLRAVLQAERKITLWQRAKKRAERFGEAMSLESEAALPVGLEGLDRMSLAETAVYQAPAPIGQEDASDSDSTGSDMQMIE